jgi:hypothetical protein
MLDITFKNYKCVKDYFVWHCMLDITNLNNICAIKCDTIGLQAKVHVKNLNALLMAPHG